MSKKQKARARSRSSTASAGGMLVGIFIGLMLGAIVAVLGAWYFTQNAPFKNDGRSSEHETMPGSGGEAPIALPGRPGGKPVEKPHFDFYTILPEGEKAAAPRPVGSDGSKAQPPRERLYLQAGAFENPAEADNVKARLALMGVEASVSRVEVQGKGTIHRVRIGPYEDQQRLDEARQELADAGIQTVPLKAQ